MIPPRVFVPVVCIATLCIGSLAACTSQQEESASKPPSTNSTPSTATSATPTPAPGAAPVAAPVATPEPAAVAAPVASASTASADTRGLFMTFCAACHGETGDGNGTTKLDRPARSFKDGGFSYGNTPDAIAKTLAYGIPGSVMPSFGKTLSDEQRIALAKYVIELGPQDMPTESPDRVMVVKDRALVARGKLPPIVEGGEEIPRGLLVGTPDGFTFAYRTDDLRLLAVYQGEFAERTDWMGRGGTQLKPLGKLVASYGAGDPETTWLIRDREAASLRTRLVHSSSAEGRAALVSELLDLTRPSAPALTRFEESVAVDRSPLGTGWVRRVRIENLTDEQQWIEYRSDIDFHAEPFRLDSPFDGPGVIHRPLGDGRFVVDWCSAQWKGDGSHLAPNHRGKEHSFPLEPRGVREIDFVTVVVANWSDEVLMQCRQEFMKRLEDARKSMGASR